LFCNYKTNINKYQTGLDHLQRSDIGCEEVRRLKIGGIDAKKQTQVFATPHPPPKMRFLKFDSDIN